MLVATIEVKRSVGEEDLVGIMELLDRARAADAHRPLGEHKWLDLAQSRRTGYAGFVARAGARSPLAGYAHLSRGSQSWALEVVVDPEHRDPSEAVRENLISVALEEVRHEGGGHVHLWVAKPGDVDDAVAARCGLHRGRDLLQMRRTLPLELEYPDLPTRPFVRGADEESWLEVNNRAFASHPEQGGWDLGTLLEREEEPWFDPLGFLLHEADGKLAGSCWTKVHADIDPPLGEIYVISVDPAFQGTGLGRGLVVAGLRYLGSCGVGTAMLYVDSTNSPALALYGSLGFTVDHVDRAYVADI